MKTKLLTLGIFLCAASRLIAQQPEPLINTSEMRIGDSLQHHLESKVMSHPEKSPPNIWKPLGFQAPSLSRHDRQVVDQPKASVATYAAWGAGIGAVVTLLGIYIALSGSGNEYVANPFSLVPVVVGGALLGALIGVIIHD